MNPQHLSIIILLLAALSLVGFGSEAAAVPTAPAVATAANGLSTSSQAQGPTDPAELALAA